MSASPSQAMHPPREAEWISWLFVGLWTLLTYATIPFGREIVQAIQRRFGPTASATAVLLVCALAAVLFAWLLWRQRRSWREAWVLLAVTALFAAAAWGLRHRGGEPLHFLQYGVLAVLLFRAFSHRTRDAGAYLLAGLAGALLGSVDETIQWIAPGRYWQLSDIVLNAYALTLALLGIAFGVRPAFVSPGFEARSLRDATRLALVLVFLVGASLLNTPPRICWLTDHVPPLAFLARNESPMAEYGHLHRIPGVVRFRSRFSEAELRRVDHARAEEAAAMLDDYATFHGYREFLERFTPITDPFLHELRVHLSSRDRRRNLARRSEGAEAREHWTAAYAEHRVLSDYFGGSVSGSRFSLEPAVVTQLEEGRIPGREYESRVSEDVLTRVGEGPVASVMALLIAVIAIVERRLAARARSRAAARPAESAAAASRGRS